MDFLSRRLRRHSGRDRSRRLPGGSLPLTLPALGALLYGGLYVILGVLLIVLWPFGRHPDLWAEVFGRLAGILSLVHAGWLVLLGLDLASLLLGKREPGSRRVAGDVAALLVMALALVSSLQMSALLPEEYGPYAREVVFSFQYDPQAGHWAWDPGNR